MAVIGQKRTVASIAYSRDRTRQTEAMDREHKGARYTTLMVSDIQRDGMGLELHWTVGGQDSVVAEIFFSDSEPSWTLNTFDCDVPLELVEELIAEAKRRLPPTMA
jgi:hypothetical protein